MTQNDKKIICSSFRGFVKTYYSYDNELYAGTFPEEWLDHEPRTGPKECKSCKDKGSWNGVFLGYCGNCAIHVYNGTRCKGFISPGVELHNSYNHDYDSAFDLYLYGVNLHEVGDTDFHDTMAEIINQYASEFIHRNPRDVLAGLNRLKDELCSIEECVPNPMPDNGFDRYMNSGPLLDKYRDVEELDEIFDKYDDVGYSQVDIDYVIAAHNKHQTNSDDDVDEC